VLCYAQSAVTRAIYHNAREYLAALDNDQVTANTRCPVADRRLAASGQRALTAVRRAARVVVLQTRVVQVLLRKVEEREEQMMQAKAKVAEELWASLRLSLQIPGVCDAPDATNDASAPARVAEALKELLKDFEGADVVHERSVELASIFRESFASLRRLQSSLEGLQAVQKRMERSAEDAVRLKRLFEGTVENVRVQLRKTLRGRSATCVDNVSAGSGADTRSRANTLVDDFAARSRGNTRSSLVEDLAFENDASDKSSARLDGSGLNTDCISSLLETLERDLIDQPIAALQTVADEVAAKLRNRANSLVDGCAARSRANTLADDFAASSLANIVVDNFAAENVAPGSPSRLGSASHNTDCILELDPENSNSGSAVSTVTQLNLLNKMSHGAHATAAVDAADDRAHKLQRITQTDADEKDARTVVIHLRSPVAEGQGIEMPTMILSNRSMPTPKLHSAPQAMPPIYLPFPRCPQQVGTRKL
jgi:hypothetical protein